MSGLFLMSLATDVLQLDGLYEDICFNKMDPDLPGLAQSANNILVITMQEIQRKQTKIIFELTFEPRFL